MSTKHTPEPWIAVGERVVGNGIIIASCSHGDIANPGRIVACVNACAGMEDPAAEIAALRARVAELETDKEVETDKESDAPQLSNLAQSLPEKFFVPCTEQEADHVYELLEINGYTPEGDCAKTWTESEGVEVFYDGTFQAHRNVLNFPVVTIAELRETLTKRT